MNIGIKLFLKKLLHNNLIGMIMQYWYQIKEYKSNNNLKKILGQRPRERDNVAIALDKGRGDFLLFAYYLEEIIKYYEKQEKYVYVICDSYSKEFLSICNHNIKNLIIVERKTKKCLYDEELVSKYGNFFEILILPLDTISKYHCNLIRNLNPVCVYSVGKNMRTIRGISRTDFRTIDKITIFEDTNRGLYAERHRMFTQNLINKKQELKLINIEVDTRKEICEEYYVVNIGASSTTKVWPLEYVKKLLELISSSSSAKAIVIGNATEDNVRFLKDAKISCDYLNIFDLEKTIDICKNAKFVITNDTGIYHLSVCLQVPTYVISAGSYIEQFIPYPQELRKEKVFYIMPHETCQTCQKQLSCYLRRKQGKVLSCLESISPEYVFQYLEPSK
ncbi:MAG: glycosyltransferase family 9 protein [Aminipila sp.]